MDVHVRREASQDQHLHFACIAPRPAPADHGQDGRTLLSTRFMCVCGAYESRTRLLLAHLDPIARFTRLLDCIEHFV